MPKMRGPLLCRRHSSARSEYSLSCATSPLVASVHTLPSAAIYVGAAAATVARADYVSPLSDRRSPRATTYSGISACAEVRLVRIAR